MNGTVVRAGFIVKPAEGVKHLVDAGDRNLRNLGYLVQFLVVDCDSDVTRFLRDAHKGDRPRRRGVLNEVGCEIGASACLERTGLSP